MRKIIVVPVFVLSMFCYFLGNAQDVKVSQSLGRGKADPQPNGKAVSDRLENRYTPGNVKESYAPSDINNKSSSTNDEKPSTGNYSSSFNEASKSRKSVDGNSSVGEQKITPGKAVSNTTEKPRSSGTQGLK